MPIATSWLYEKRIVVQKHMGTVTGKQLTESFDDLKAFLERGDKPVHVLIDASQQGSHVDIGIGDLKAIVPRVFDGIGWLVIIQPHALQRFFTSLGMQISRAKYKFVQDQTEAVEFLLEHDPTLHDVIR